jgi:hypothetical protein
MTEEARSGDASVRDTTILRRITEKYEGILLRSYCNSSGKVGATREYESDIPIRAPFYLDSLSARSLGTWHSEDKTAPQDG